MCFLFHVKLIFCFPEQERNLFLHKFLESLQGNVVPGLPHTYDTEKAYIVCKNLRQ